MGVEPDIGKFGVHCFAVKNYRTMISVSSCSKCTKHGIEPTSPAQSTGILPLYDWVHY